jgi:malonate transporter
MSSLTETVLLVFGLVALGYLAGLVGYMKVESGDGLSEFAVGVAMPVLLFRTMTNADFHGSAPWALWAAYFTAATVAWTAGHLVTTRIFGRDSQAGVVGGVATAFSNLVLLGIPFMFGVFGQDGVDILSLIISVHLPSMMMASIVLFQIFGRAKGAPIQPLAIATGFLRKILMNPLVVGILAGLVWRASGLLLSGLALRFVDSLAGIGGTVALFAMGLGLRKFGISGNVRPAIVLSLLKLFLMPAVALGMAWLLGLPPLSAKVAVAAAALPSGVNSYLIATQFGTGQALASNQMTIATAFAVVTISFWLTVAHMVFG